MFVLSVVVFKPFSTQYSYLSDTLVERGCRVHVPFGKASTIGVVWDAKAYEAALVSTDFELRKITSVLDASPRFSQVNLELADWMSKYYCYPLGEVLKAMLPASGSTDSIRQYFMTEEAEKLWREKNTEKGHILRLLFSKRAGIAEQALKKKVQRSQAAGDIVAGELKRLEKEGLITKERKDRIKISVAGGHADAKLEPGIRSAPNQKPPQLTEKQQGIFEAIVSCGLTNVSTKKPILLWGITGAGKTEIYLRVLAKVFAMHEGEEVQALIMVPEISLTPQMTRVFEARFPDRVAVVHSAMASAERWNVLEMVRTGVKNILIGPRSAMFAAFANLQLIVVDEEHDHSYKQTSGLNYHGRDIAVVRGRLENACVILGSATPSLESYQNALSGKYTLLSLLERIGESRLPQVELIDSPPIARRGVLTDLNRSHDERDNPWEIPIAPRIIEELAVNYQRGEQSMVIVNRRGFACYLYSLKDEKPVCCPQCSISMTVHNKGKILRCHYCNASLPVKRLMEREASSEYIAVGYGSQKAEDYLREALGGAVIERIDSDSVAKRGFLTEKLEEFALGKIDVLVGTQILAKGHDFSNVTLIVLLEVDQILNLPDFRAGERVFQLLVQSAGRAGRGRLPGRVLLQTRRSNHAIITAGLQQDYQLFAQKELSFRAALGYPPFSRMVDVEIECKNQKKLGEFTQFLQDWLVSLMKDQPIFFRAVRILGPSIPLAEVVRGYFRRNLLFISSDLPVLRRFIGIFSAFAKPPHGIRLKMDIDPQSIV